MITTQTQTPTEDSIKVGPTSNEKEQFEIIAKYFKNIFLTKTRYNNTINITNTSDNTIQVIRNKKTSMEFTKARYYYNTHHKLYLKNRRYIQK